MEQTNPTAYVSQPDKDPDESDWLFDAPNFVLVLDDQTQLWASGTHYVSDPDGAVAVGQRYMMRDPDMGVYLSEITAVNPTEETATVRHFLRWVDGEVDTIDDVETIEWDVITGEYDRPMSESSVTEFIREFRK